MTGFVFVLAVGPAIMLQVGLTLCVLSALFVKLLLVCFLDS